MEKQKHRKMSFDLPWLSFHNVIHTIEEFKLPLPSSRTVAFAGLAAVPIAVLLHDTSDLWLPKTVNLPILSFFTRRWKKDEENKALDLALFRNGLLFLWVCAIIREGEPKHAPLDYVMDRLSNSSARKILTHDIMQSRKAAFGGATQFAMGVTDPEKAIQLRDAALRRRQVQEDRAQLD